MLRTGRVPGKKRAGRERDADCHSTVALHLRSTGKGTARMAAITREPTRDASRDNTRRRRGRGTPGVRCRGGAGGGRRVARRRMGAGHVSWPGRIM